MLQPALFTGWLAGRRAHVAAPIKVRRDAGVYLLFYLTGKLRRFTSSTPRTKGAHRIDTFDAWVGRTPFSLRGLLYIHEGSMCRPTTMHVRKRDSRPVLHIAAQPAAVDLISMNGLPIIVGHIVWSSVFQSQTMGHDSSRLAPCDTPEQFVVSSNIRGGDDVGGRPRPSGHDGSNGRRRRFR